VRSPLRVWREIRRYDPAPSTADLDRDRGGRRAAFTIVHNEPLWLPLWLKHYRRFFAAEDIYVLDHDSTDDSTRDLAGECIVVPVHREAAFDHRWLRSVVQDFQAFLLRSHEVVLFAEVDEFIVADPQRYAGLDAYIDQLEGSAVRCSGFNVVQQTGEPALRFDSPLLAQRGYWHPSPYYSKRLISRIPLRWTVGFHEEFNAPEKAPDPELLLLHLQRADYDTCLRRHRASVARDWSRYDVEKGLGSQNRISDPHEFEEWFRAGPEDDGSREPIPDHIKELL